MSYDKDLLKGKNILMILPKYFGYEKVIEDGLKNYGATVHVIYENLDEINVLYRFIYVYLKKSKESILQRYYKKRNNELLSFQADYVFVIRGASVTSDTMNLLRKTYSTARFIMYQWDGVKNNPQALKISNDFDKVLTFDEDDAEKYGWEYRPLFFSDVCTSHKEKDIDVLYLCSLHSKRVEILNTLKIESVQKRFSLFHYLYAKRLIYIKKKYFNRNGEFIDAVDRDVRYKALTRNETDILYQRSRCVVDYTHPGQSGFTMRTIESLGNRCKLITNNKRILKADFYRKENIYVYDENKFDIPVSFIKSLYKEIDDRIYDYYSLGGWIRSVFEEK